MKTIFKLSFAQFACALALFAASSFSAQAQSTTTDDAVYQGLGAKEGITKIVNDFIPIILADARISRFFEKMEKEQFAESLTDQLCQLAGGPCKYKGNDMATAHYGMSINNAHFNALAEDLQIAMEKNNIPSSISNKLVAKLAPMQKSIVNK